MSVQAPPPIVPPPMPSSASVVSPPRRAEALLDEHLVRTSRQVRSVDVVTGLVVLAIGVIGYLFLAALADHWLVPGGLGVGVRVFLLLVLLAGVGAYGFWFVLRPLLQRINPVYVAQTIEQSEPTLKNSLINFLLLRRQPAVMAPAVFEALERRAASDAAQVAPEVAVDRGHLLRLGYVLIALVLIGAIYQVASPKNPLVSAFRVLWPFGGLSAPTRVTFGDVTPGDAEVFRGQTVVVSAEVNGLRDDEPVLLHFTTADGQSVDQIVPMTVPEDGRRHACSLPPDSFGLQQDTTYYLTAGDGRSPTFALSVQTPPSIGVKSVEYHYPAYTGLPNRTSTQGDLRAIEGTTVTIRAEANLPIRRAEIDLGCRGTIGLPMLAQDRQATGECTLRLRPDDPSRPEYDSYQLRFTDQRGRDNPRPIRHEIEVVADRPPTVELIDPPADKLELPLNQTLEWKIRAEDPDFGLRDVGVRAEREGRSLPLSPALEKAMGEPSHQGVFQGVVRFEPSKLELKPGDVVTYWAEAQDGKQPVPGTAKTEPRTLTIVSPEIQPHRAPPRDEKQQPQANPQDRANAPAQNRPEQNNAPGEKNPPKQGDQPKKDGAKDGGQGEPDKSNQNDRPDTTDEPGEKSEQGNQAGQNQANQPNPADSSESKDDKGNKDKQQAEKGQQDNESPQGPGENQQNQSGDQGQKGDSSNQGDPSKQGDQKSDKPSEPIDGKTNPGDVFEKALQQKAEQEKQQSPQQPPDQNQSNQQQPGQSGSEPSGPKSGGGQQEPSEKNQQGPAGQQERTSEQNPGQGNQANQQPGGESGKTSAENQPGQPGSDSPKNQGGGSPNDSTERQPGEKSDGSKRGEPKPGGETSDPSKKGEPATDQSPLSEPKKDQPPTGGSRSDQAKPDQPLSSPPGGQQPPEPGETYRGEKGSPDQKTEPKSKPIQKIPDPNCPGGNCDKPGASGPGEKSGGQGGSGVSGTSGQSKGGDSSQGANPTGKPGAGRPTGENQKTPPAVDPNQQGPESSKPDKGDPSHDKEQATSPSTSPGKSTTEGNTSGEQSGGGEEGGGMRADRKGQGTAGSNTEADEGAGRGKEPGEGETSDKPGDQAKGDGPGGKAAKTEPGEGSRSQPTADVAGKPSDAGQANQGSTDAQRPGEGALGQSVPRQLDQESKGGVPQPGRGQATSGGHGTAQGDLPPQDVPEPGGDAFNKDYAEKQTSLALEYLKEQLAKEKPDPKLLDALGGWTRDDLRDFVQRWEAMRAAAAEPGEQGKAARKRFDEALRSLGLHRGHSDLRSTNRADEARGMRESRRVAPPPGWEEQLDDYRRGIGQER